MGFEKKTIAEAYQVRLTDNASQNIDEIADYIGMVNRQPSNAIMVVDKIYSQFDKIKKNPFAFKECPSLPSKSKMYRQANCYNWQIIFRVLKDEIAILIHGSRKRSRIKLLSAIK